jgi:hypothetical protein
MASTSQASSASERIQLAPVIGSSSVERAFHEFDELFHRSRALIADSRPTTRSTLARQSEANRGFGPASPALAPGGRGLRCASRSCICPISLATSRTRSIRARCSTRWSATQSGAPRRTCRNGYVRTWRTRAAAGELRLRSHGLSDAGGLRRPADSAATREIDPLRRSEHALNKKRRASRREVLGRQRRAQSTELARSRFADATSPPHRALPRRPRRRTARSRELPRAARHDIFDPGGAGLCFPGIPRREPPGMQPVLSRSAAQPARMRTSRPTARAHQAGPP